MWRLQCVVESAEFAKATGERTNYGPCFELGMTSPGKMRTPNCWAVGAHASAKLADGGGRRRFWTLRCAELGSEGPRGWNSEWGGRGKNAMAR